MGDKQENKLGIVDKGDAITDKVNVLREDIGGSTNPVMCSQQTLALEWKPVWVLKGK